MAGCLLLGALACGLNGAFSHHGFDGYDLSPMIDSGWRVYSGQVPGRDFLATFPPSHYLLTALMFRVFGVSWHALVVGASCFFGMMLLLGLRLAALVRKVYGEDAAVCVAVAFTAGQIIFLLPYSTIWHATIAMDFAMYGIGATYLLAGQGRAGLRREAMAHLSFAVAFLLLSKANTAYPTIVLCLIVAGMCSVGRRGLLLIAGGGLVMASLALWMVHITLFGMLASYGGLAGRLLPIGFFYAILYYRNDVIALSNLLVYAIMAPALVMVLAHAWKTRTRPVVVLGAGSILIALLAMGTNIQFKLSDTPLMLLGFVLIAWSGGASYVRMKRRVMFTVFTLTLVALYFGRTRMAFVASGEWNTEGCAQVALQDAFLGAITGCPVMQTTLSEVDRTLAENPGAKVFFGSGLEFLYAGRMRPSPGGMPNWWHPGTSYPLVKGDEIGAAWTRDQFDVLIFNAAEYREQMPAGIGAAIDREYMRVDDTTHAIHVYKLRR